VTSVVIVDDHALFRAGVRTELEGAVDVLADAGTVPEGVRAVVEHAPDVVLLDVHMPGGGGLEVIRQVAAQRPSQRFLALSVSDAPEDVIAVIRAGARGYVTKTIQGAELADAVRRVADGDAVFSPRLAGFVLDAFTGEPSAPAAPDVVLLDVHMPGGGGLEVIRQVTAQRPAQRFLALSVSDAPEDVIAVIRAGARGYVTKTIQGGELADAVRRVADGDAVFSPRLAGFVLDAFAGEPPAAAAPDAASDLDQLTPREREVLQHIARGYLYKEVALRLGISAKTVEAHVSSVLRKLQLSTRHELSRWAMERRLVD
jgi:DNA-binding NarL/FixJ family response regulator